MQQHTNTTVHEPPPKKNTNTNTKKPTVRASPKSARTTLVPFSRMLSGLRSRWVYPHRCMRHNPLAIWPRNHRASTSGSAFWDRAITLPSKYSLSVKSYRGVTSTTLATLVYTTSHRGRMLGWGPTAARACASRRALMSNTELSTWDTLPATGSPRALCMPAYTTAYDPAPTSPPHAMWVRVFSTAQSRRGVLDRPDMSFLNLPTLVLEDLGNAHGRGLNTQTCWCFVCSKFSHVFGLGSPRPPDHPPRETFAGQRSSTRAVRSQCP
jgi:hypothetical protein